MKVKSIKRLLVFVLCSLLLVGSSFIFPFYMKAVSSSLISSVWIFITNTGSTMGVAVIVMVTSVFLIKRMHSIRDKIKVLLISLIAFGAVIGGLALVNEHLIKENLKVYRPNIVLLEKYCGFNSDVFYSLEGVDDRREYIKVFFSSNTLDDFSLNGTKIFSDVIQLWAKETGFSFPSGHSVSSFLLASILGYLLLYYSVKGRYWLIAFIYLWAISVSLSRVLLGVHTSFDVTLGALWGSSIGFLILMTGAVDWVLLKKDDEK